MGLHMNITRDSLPLDNYGDDGIMISADRMRRGSSLSGIHHDSSAVEGRYLTVFCKSFIKNQLATSSLLRTIPLVHIGLVWMVNASKWWIIRKVSDQPDLQSNSNPPFLSHNIFGAKNVLVEECNLFISFLHFLLF
ncbi:hypothetical protein TNCT_605741 [Trichonephila clavata]|uniref:Uncharacterized protein n=1 Tax=Trichonephila clavata TaxID=2740835 RepID=A0A8X6KBT0_TRICU|nr:hypothetical protein TNCT_605741 [Trichonephila clavata]